MPKQTKSKLDTEQIVLDLVMQLTQCLQSIEKISFNEIFKLFYECDYPALKEERKLVQEIIDILRRSNSQISPRQIFNFLINDVVGIVIVNPEKSITNQELSELAGEKIRLLLRYSSIREIDIPIMFLRVEDTPVKIGLVTFYSISEEEKNSEWWQKVKLNYSGNPDLDVLSFGRIVAPGDWELSLDYAENKLRETLLIIRAIGLPFTNNPKNQFGMLNEFSASNNKPFLLHKPNETTRIDGTSEVVTRLGPLIGVYGLKTDLFKSVDENILLLLNQLLTIDNRSLLTDMQVKYISGLIWLGESTKPDKLTFRYLKLSTALEHFIGGESGNEYLSTRGVTATLAERAAFLLGIDPAHRHSIDHKVKHFYGLRSKIVHGNRDVIDETDFSDFGNLVRQIAFALSGNLISFNTVDTLQEWILRMRYS